MRDAGCVALYHEKHLPAPKHPRNIRPPNQKQPTHKGIMGRIYNNIVETVGRTPLVRLNKVTAGLDATILLKCEFFNPLGSVKDRIGMAMIDAAEKSGQLTK